MLFVVTIAILALVSLPTPSASQGDNTTLPLTVLPRVSEQGCLSDEVQEIVREEITQDNRNLMRNTITPILCGGPTQASPAASCSALPTSCPSGYYWIRIPNGTAVQLYCDVDRVCGCSSTEVWTRVAYLNMRNPSQLCPGEWTLQTYSSEPRRLCGSGNGSSSDPYCVSAVYSTYGISYSHVCGRVIGYAHTSPDAFRLVASQTLEDSYVDGVSLTHGSPGARQHIWTFAGGLFETYNSIFHPSLFCPCVNGTTVTDYVPSYVGNDYFCESGNPGSALFTNILYGSDPLWDGQGCGSPPCCELSFPPGVTAPWFCKQLPQATTDDIEVRICKDEGTTSEDTPVERIELYIR